MSIDEAGTPTGTLTKDVLQSMSVQENDGTYQVSIPKEAARDLGLRKRDQVLITGKAGDRRLNLRTSADILADD